MVANVVRCLGVHVGSEFFEENEYGTYEDLELVKAHSHEEILAAVDRKNQNFSVWGWKYPDMLYVLDSIHQNLINPHFIFIYRDPCAIALCDQRKYSMPIDRGLILASSHLALQVRTYARLKDSYPTMSVSYEKAMTDKRIFVTRLASFLGMGLSKEKIDAGMEGFTK